MEKSTEHNISLFKKGEYSFVKSLKKDEISLKLMEMGILPGVKLTMEGAAPFGDPIQISINDEYSLYLRHSEAENIILE